MQRPVDSVTCNKDTVLRVKPSCVTSGNYFLVDQGGPECPWSTTQYHGPAGAPGALLVHLDPARSTACNHTPEIADQGGLRWTRGTMGTMELGVGPGALSSCFYILLMGVSLSSGLEEH